MPAKIGLFGLYIRIRIEKENSIQRLRLYHVGHHIHGIGPCKEEVFPMLGKEPLFLLKSQGLLCGSFKGDEKPILVSFSELKRKHSISGSNLQSQLFILRNQIPTDGKGRMWNGGRFKSSHVEFLIIYSKVIVMRKKLKILILIHPELNPLKIGLKASKHVDSPCKTESFVYSTLKSQGHFPEFLELESDIDPLVHRVNSAPVDVVFNLLEELSGEAKFDFHAISYLESKGIRFTGNGPRALMLTRDKRLSKLVVEKEGIVTPKSFLIRKESDLKGLGLQFPVFLKLNMEDASLGIDQSNRVENIEQLRLLFRRLRKISGQPVLAEEFVPGTDVSVGVIGNKKLATLPVRELRFPNKNWVAGEGVKFQSELRRKNKIKSKLLRWESQRQESNFSRKALQIYRALGMRGYGRIDFRKTKDQKFYFLEANANPDLSKDEDFAMSASSAGMRYPVLLEKILKLGLEETRRS